MQYPQFAWPIGPNLSLPDLFNLLRISFPDLNWPPMPDVDLPEWQWPDMPAIKFPELPQLTPPVLQLPHWDAALFCFGINFEGFSVKLRILISLFQVVCWELRRRRLIWARIGSKYGRGTLVARVVCGMCVMCVA